MHKSKNIEEYLIKLMSGESIIDVDKYTSDSILMFNILTKSGITTFNNPSKPKVKDKPLYSNKGEPKTDIKFSSNGTEYKISVKQDDRAYISSCNSSGDFITIFINLHDGYNILSDNMIGSLKKVSTMIRKIPNFYSFDSTYKSDVNSFIYNKFSPKATKLVGEKKAIEYSNYLINCYNDKDKQNEYITELNNSELFVQNTMKTLFNEYPDYSKKILKELISGSLKFKNSDASCDYVLDREDLYTVDQYVDIIYNKYNKSSKVARLQNIPRKKIKKSTLLSGDKKIISEEFSIADLTFKI